MAGQGWRKNKKGFMVNPDGKTAFQVRQKKYYAKMAKQDVSRNFEMASQKLEAAKKSKNPTEKKNAELLFQAAKRDMLNLLSPEKTKIGIVVSSSKLDPSRFTKATAIIPVMGRDRNDPPASTEIEGKVLGDYIVHKGGFTGKYAITHIKSGLAITWKKIYN